MSKQLTVYNYTRDQVNLIKRTIAKDTTDDELELFLYTAQRLKLDPLAKQIYCIKIRGQMVTLTGIDGYRCVADQTGQYAPGKDTVFTYDEKGNLKSATAYVKKLTLDGTWHEVSATALLAEYKGKTPIWSSLPHVMLEKCAEARALRRCFPSQLSGVYTREEMEQAEVDTPSTKKTKAKVETRAMVIQAIRDLKADLEPAIKKICDVDNKDPKKVWWNLVVQVLGSDYAPSETRNEADVLDTWSVSACDKMRKALL